MCARCDTVVGWDGVCGGDAGEQDFERVSLVPGLCVGVNGVLTVVSSAKLYEIGAGTSEIRRMVIGRAFNKEYAGQGL